jgi:hypothetical protein
MQSDEVGIADEPATCPLAAAALLRSVIAAELLEGSCGENSKCHATPAGLEWLKPIPTIEPTMAIPNACHHESPQIDHQRIHKVKYDFMVLPLE